MLVLSRKVGERLVIGEGVTVQVAGVTGKRVRLAIAAPKTVKIVREEIKERKSA